MEEVVVSLPKDAVNEGNDAVESTDASSQSSSSSLTQVGVNMNVDKQKKKASSSNSATAVVPAVSPNYNYNYYNYNYNYNYNYMPQQQQLWPPLSPSPYIKRGMNSYYNTTTQTQYPYYYPPFMQPYYIPSPSPSPYINDNSNFIINPYYTTPPPLLHSPSYFPPPPPLANLIVNQIDYYFSDYNLATDVYLRKRMDEEGWVPIALIAGFRRVSQLSKDTPFILKAMRRSFIVEVKGEKVRRRGSWKKWLLNPSQE